MDKTTLKKCSCGEKNGMSCKNCSRIKLVILTNWNYKNHLIGDNDNPAYYSRIRMNNWSPTTIADATFNNLTTKEKQPIYTNALQHCSWVVAYDTITNQEIKRYKA
ncbi:hypothetical protein [Mangrovimonas cancribranchiae]|uniref:Uncharacterized protein n=1 Tax=Mangrovimonas cancribranchiae TaxID=3080055 RepID=A0AAU6NX55_9FLAO